MKITIEISKRLVKHLCSPHSFNDECEPACEVLRKVQREMDRKLRKGAKA